MAEDGQSDISSTLGSETGLKSVTPSVTERHEATQASLERGTSIVLPQGTKVTCTHRNWAGEVFAHRVKEFAKPNGKTERVLQYYVDFAENKFQWRDGDILAVLTPADFWQHESGLPTMQLHQDKLELNFPQKNPFIEELDGKMKSVLSRWRSLSSGESLILSRA